MNKKPCKTPQPPAILWHDCHSVVAGSQEAIRRWSRGHSRQLVCRKRGLRIFRPDTGVGPIRRGTSAHANTRQHETAKPRAGPPERVPPRRDPSATTPGTRERPFPLFQAQQPAPKSNSWPWWSSGSSMRNYILLV